MQLHNKLFALRMRVGHGFFNLHFRSEVKLVAALTVFCDETCTHKGAPVTCVGGYVFEENPEHEFTEKWADVLEPLRERGIRYFHASPCDAPDDEFVCLSYAERLALFGDLISLVRRTAKIGLAATIKDEVFKAAMARNKIQRFTGSKYTACALRLFAALGIWADNNAIEGKILYQFESGSGSQDEADLMMKRIAASPELAARFRYGGHGFQSKESLLPLQAADLWVWLLQKSLREGKRSPYMRNLLSKPGSIPHYVDEYSEIDLGIHAMINWFYDIDSIPEEASEDGERSV